MIVVNAIGMLIVAFFLMASIVGLSNGLILIWGKNSDFQTYYGKSIATIIIFGVTVYIGYLFNHVP
jgi:hypothetical protein